MFFKVGIKPYFVPRGNHISIFSNLKNLVKPQPFYIVEVTYDKNTKNFPLSDAEALAFKQNLREHILCIHEAEKQVITALEKTFML